MGLIQKLKSALGLDGAQSPESGTAAPRDVDVTVEREPSSETEDAVKGTETAASGTGRSAEADSGTNGVDESSRDEPPIEEAEPEVTDSSLDEFGETAGETETDAVDDPDEAADLTVDETPDATVEDATDPTDEPTADDAAADESVEDDAAADESTDLSDDPVTEISGIGPAYGQRLADAGVDTVADLAAADASELEAATEISASRIEGWIDAAAEY